MVCFFIISIIGTVIAVSLLKLFTAKRYKFFYKTDKKRMRYDVTLYPIYICIVIGIEVAGPDCEITNRKVGRKVIAYAEFVVQ